MIELFGKVPTEVAYVFMAAVGGIARYLQSYLNEGAFAWQHFVAHTFVSAFSGYMFYQFGSNVVGLPASAMPVVAGLGGWMGVEALKMLEAFIKRKWFNPK